MLSLSQRESATVQVDVDGKPWPVNADGKPILKV